MSAGYGFTLAVCAEMVFRDQPVLDRVRHIHELGFASRSGTGPPRTSAALAATGARFTSMTGYIEGNLTGPDGAEALLRTAEESIAAAGKLGTPNLNLHGTGLGPQGLPVRPVDTVTGAMWMAAKDPHPHRRLGEREGVVFCLENLNTAVDHPGTPFARAADTRALVQAVSSPHLRMNLDLYHAQIGEGNLIQLIGDSIGWVGEIQVADVPGRCEPGTGEISYPAVRAGPAPGRLRRRRGTGSVRLRRQRHRAPALPPGLYRSGRPVGARDRHGLHLHGTQTFYGVSS